jgi:hypothetical protein
MQEEKLFVAKLSQLNNFYLEDVILSRVSEEIRGLFETSEDRVKHETPDYQVGPFIHPSSTLGFIDHY